MRPTLPCLCEKCRCRLHIYAEGDHNECVWCRAGEHDGNLEASK